MLQTLTPYLLRVCRSVDALRRLVILLVLAAFAPALRAGANSAPAAKRSYNIASGDASTTLRQFVEQSGEQVIYVVPKVRGVTTNAVRGEFAAREVLERMVNKTALMVVEDEKSGALTITRNRRGNGDTTAAPPGGPAAQSLSEPANITMKNKTPLAMLRAFLGLAVAAPIAGAASDGAATGTITGRVQNVATGQYLNNARVTAAPNLVAFTDETGIYHLTNVPRGPVILTVFYTGLDPQQVTLQVAADQITTQDVNLTSIARYGDPTSVVKLSPFVVSSEKQLEGDALATNERRFAPNIKNVMATDSLGDIMGDSVGDFLKFLPGLTAEYSGDEIVSIGARGFGGNLTNFNIDGAPIASADTLTLRTVRLSDVSLGSTSRVEVTKVPTPAMPADSLAGSINMVSKSAFERSRAELKYGINLIANNDKLRLSKTPTPFDNRTLKIQPGFDFDYTLPVNKNLGIVIAGMYDDKFNPQHLSAMAYAVAATGGTASASSPFLQTHTLTDGPRNQRRRSGSIKVDWRIAPNAVFSVGIRSTDFLIEIGSTNWVVNAGNVATPNPANLPGGVPLSYGPDYTIGASGRGSITMNTGFQTVSGIGTTGNMNYRFDNGKWKIETGVSLTDSRRYSRPEKAGQFSNAGFAMISPRRVTFTENTPDRPGQTAAFDNTNREVEVWDVSNLQFATANLDTFTTLASYRSATANLRRSLDFLPVPAAIQLGGMYGAQRRDKVRTFPGYTYNGPDGNPSTVEPLPDFSISQVYRNLDNGWGFKNRPFPSLTAMYQAFRENPRLFSETPAQLVATETFRINNTEAVEEAVSSLYVQGEARFFSSRLRLLTGARYEQTKVKGSGPLFDPNEVYQRNAAGLFLRNAAGARIRKPEAGSVGSLEELRLIRKERAYNATRTYDGYYPSIHVTYALRENLLLRSAYARTYGRPDFSNIVPTTTVNQADLTEDELQDPSITRGTITVRNTGLHPWTADNYDLSVEHYSSLGGVFSAGVFQKEIKDFFGSQVINATLADLERLGLDAQYVGWRVSTTINSGDARVSGAEFDIRQPLRPLGEWGRYFSVFANVTKLRLEGNRQADFSSFIRDSRNWGFNFNWKRVMFIANWNYRGLDRRAAVASLGPDGASYIKARTRLDLNVGYQLTPRFRLTLRAGNVFNVPQTFLAYGSQTPEYARQTGVRDYGVPLALSLKGTY